MSEQITADLLDPSLVGERVPLERIPIVDFTPFLSGEATAKRAVAASIDDACRNIGFFYITNHGVPRSLVDRAFAESIRFFAQPVEVKSRIAIEKSACHRGWFSVGGENLDVRRQKEGDLKEGIKIGRDLPMDHPLVLAGTPLHGPNQWPDDLPGWKEFWLDYYATMVDLGKTLMRAFALALRMPERFFEDKLTDPMCTAGPLHYPPQTGRITEERLGAGAHTDFGCLTMLAQDDNGGLQVRNSAGRWIDAPPLPGSFVVNVGDMLARWTNDLYASTLHRVINRSGRERYSIPFFFDPNFNADLTVLPTCVSADRPAKYPPTTGGQHLLDRINETFNYYGQKHSGGRAHA